MILVYLTKYSEILPWTIEQKIFCMKKYYETKSFKKQKEVQFQQESDFQDGQVDGTCEDHTISVLKIVINEKIQVIIWEERLCVINNFVCHISQCLQLNGRHLELVVLGSSWHFWFMFETKWLVWFLCLMAYQPL